MRRGISGAATWKPSAADWKRFNDVTSSTPHAEDILWLASAGIATGYSNGTFGGMRPVYRQDMAAFKRFNDVTSSTPHAEDILWLASAGIATGYSNGTFGGMRPVYRQDMAAFLKRLADKAGKTGGVTPKTNFTDVTDRTPHKGLFSS